jgi:hypothetical protein
VGGQRYVPAILPPGKTRYPLYMRLGGPQGWSGRVRKISSPPGFDPRTVHPLASRYTDWDISTHVIIIIIIIIIIIGISFMHGIYTYIPETNHVPREHCVATILM